MVPPGRDLHPGAILELDDAEAHHLMVRRAAAGETLRVLDGAGLVAYGTLLDGRRASVSVTEARRVPASAPLELAVGAGDKDRFTWLAEKATELGVTSLVPLETERTAHVANRVRGAHAEKLARRALEAAKQSGAPWATRVREPESLASYLANAPVGLRWLADGEGPVAPSSIGSDPIAVLVGPEGGFTDGERGAALAAGFRPVRLGANILRFETAALAAAAHVGIARPGAEGGGYGGDE